MKPAPRDSRELVAWAASILERERQRGTTGAVRVEVHEGVIQRVRIESVEKPVDGAIASQQKT